MPTTALIHLRLFDGARAPVAQGQEYLVRLVDGAGRQRGLFQGSGGEHTLSVPFFDNSDDMYTVLGSAHGCRDTGVRPVRVKPAAAAVVDLMIVPNHPTFDFTSAGWDAVRQASPQIFPALCCGTTPDAARDRCETFLRAGAIERTSP